MCVCIRVSVCMLVYSGELCVYVQQRTMLCNTPGLLRGVDPERRVLYLTTPEGAERLTQVNILVAGNNDSPDFMVSPNQV